MIFELITLLHFLFVTGFTIRILVRNNLTPTTRLTWFLVILILPYIGAVIYWMFGEADVGFHADSKRQKILTQLEENHPEVLGNKKYLEEHIEQQYCSAFAYASSVNGFQLTAGNSARLMRDAKDTTSNMIADFDAATDHIHILYYIWLEDETGISIANALMRAAQRGVKCRVMADGLGSRKFIASSTWKKMQACGVDVAVALPLKNPIRTLIFSRIDLRNHRKITIIDGKITYCGSNNCADPEFRVKAKYAPWVDIMLRFEGPIVAQNQLLFASDWLVRNPSTDLNDFVYSLEAKPHGFYAQVFADGPTERRDATPQLFTLLFAQAQEKLIISTPYFVPDYSVVNGLCAAAHRGVKVVMIFPQRNDSFVVSATSKSYYRQLLESGVIIYEFKDGLLHAKTMTIDGSITLIGSTNLDLRSFDLNYENNILLRDDELTVEVQHRQQDYIEHSHKILLDDVLKWSLPRRIWYNIVAMLGPVL